MSKTLKVNFSELSQRGVEQKELAETFEKARENYQTIINSLNECWEGIDATAFMKSCNNYLEYLKNDTLYFDTLSEYFGACSMSYGKVVAENKEKASRLNSMIENSNQNDNL